MVKEIVKSHDVVFSNRPKKTYGSRYLAYGCKDLGFAPHGEYWKQIKKISVVELLNHQRVQSFQFVREEEVEVVIDKIRNVCLKGESINLTETLALVSNNIISRCVLSQKSEEDDDGKCNKFWSSSKRLMVIFTSFCFGDMFPYLGWLDMITGLIPSLKALSREIDTFLAKIIEEH
ncbi:hypothetical protein Goklo_019488 [Gossypium klotzschianum]|uniref:Cytochrome P450 n=1 Tax=Gossypium klotzschianum TaxID=34286 RepID=A0A7J8UNX6_9ROSI|nr:hypothetical protein [Gossypium klotzschianum]